MNSHRVSTQPQLLSASRNSPSLKRGAHGDGVAELQRFLRSLRHELPFTFAGGKPDGVFGAETERAVKKFQTANQLTPDGIAGAKTIARMDEVLLEKPHLDSADPVRYQSDLLTDTVRPIGQRRTFHI